MGSRFSVPSWVRENQLRYEPESASGRAQIDAIRERLRRFSDPDPEVSIVIPAYNEEKDLLSTLSTLSRQETTRRVELLVVNNNSRDRTQEILDACGVRSFFEPRQGISFTRQTGLEQARGRFYINADADSLYPPGWVEAHVNTLSETGVRCSYGRHSFVPEPGQSRVGLALYEIVAETYFAFRRLRKREYLNVLGFNFGIYRQDALDVGGFNINRQRWQDGWMAMQMLRLGRLSQVKVEGGRVWTSDRRLRADGTLSQAFRRRLRLHVTKLLEYWYKKPGSRQA